MSTSGGVRGRGRQRPLLLDLTLVEQVARSTQNDAASKSLQLEFPLLLAIRKDKRRARMQQEADLQSDPVEQVFDLFGQAPRVFYQRRA